MSAVTLYRQARADGALRTGIDVDDETILESFEPSREDSDPALLWYVDVRCNGEALPTSPEGAREWFTLHSDLVRDALTSLAEDVNSGIDVGPWPVQRPVTGAPAGVEKTLACSATRRVNALAISQVLHEVASGFEGFLADLRPLGKLVR